MDHEHAAPSTQNPTKETIAEFYHSYHMIACCLVASFFLVLIWLFLNEYCYLKVYEKEYISPEEFALQAKNFPQGLTEKEIRTWIFAAFKHLEDKYELDGSPLYEIECSQSKELLNTIKEMETIDLQIQRKVMEVTGDLKKMQFLNILGNFRKMGKRNVSININNLRRELEAELGELTEQTTGMKDSVIMRNQASLKSCIHVLKKIEEDQERMAVLRQRYDELRVSQTVNKVIVVFKTIKLKKFFEKVKSKNFCQTLFCCCQKLSMRSSSSSINKKQRLIQEIERLYFVECSAPVNINWMSSTDSILAKFLRRALSWTTYFILYFLRKKNNFSPESGFPSIQSASGTHSSLWKIYPNSFKIHNDI